MEDQFLDRRGNAASSRAPRRSGPGPVPTVDGAWRSSCKLAGHSPARRRPARPGDLSGGGRPYRGRLSGHLHHGLRPGGHARRLPAAFHTRQAGDHAVARLRPAESNRACRHEPATLLTARAPLCASARHAAMASGDPAPLSDEEIRSDPRPRGPPEPHARARRSLPKAARSAGRA